MKERATFLRDIPQMGGYFFNPPSVYDEKTIQKKWKEESGELMRDWKSKLEQINDFNEDQIEAGFKAFLEEKELGIGKVLPLFRVLITGQGMGPSMFAIAALLGKEECLDRISNGVEKLG